MKKLFVVLCIIAIVMSSIFIWRSCYRGKIPSNNIVSLSDHIIGNTKNVYVYADKAFIEFHTGSTKEWLEGKKKPIPEKIGKLKNWNELGDLIERNSHLEVVSVNIPDYPFEGGRQLDGRFVPYSIDDLIAYLNEKY